MDWIAVRKKLFRIFIGYPCLVIAYGSLAIQILYAILCVALFLFVAYLWGTRILFFISMFT